MLGLAVSSGWWLVIFSAICLCFCLSVCLSVRITTLDSSAFHAALTSSRGCCPVMRAACAVALRRGIGTIVALLTIAARAMKACSC